VPRVPADPTTAIGSSDGPMQQKSQHSKAQVRIFYTREVPLEHIDEHNDVHQHDESKPRTPHDSKEERIIDGEEAILHGAERIKITRLLYLTFLVDYACVSNKIRRLQVFFNK
jgi:hypothetical protein